MPKVTFEGPDSERGNFYAKTENGDAALIIRAEGGFLWVEVVPENYPSCMMSTIGTIEEVKDLIKGYHSRGWDIIKDNFSD
jgi:hypothetical protein